MAFDAGAPIITFNLYAQNTSSADLILNSFAANLFANNTLIGNVSNFSQVVIPGNSSTLIPLTARLQIIGLANDIIRAFQTNSFTQDLQLTGNANVNGVQIPIDLTLKVGA